jgi:Tetratricopeptide repeat
MCCRTWAGEVGVPGAFKYGICLPLVGILFLTGCAESWPLRALTGAVVTSAQESTSVLTVGRNHLAAGRFGLAIEAFRKAAKADPNSIEALNGLAVAYDHIGRYDLAVYQYERALILDPGSVRTLNNFGYSYMLQGNFDLATVYLREALQRDSANPAIAANRAIAEAALRASRPRPKVQWLSPSDRDASPLPSAWVERTTPVVQTLVTQPKLLLVSTGPAPDRPEMPRRADTFPDMLAAPIGDTRLAAVFDLLPRPISAAMTDAWIVDKPASRSGGENDEPSG